jgi:DNA helicase-2/ATP-dependent DNA helicase PcrA
MIRDAVNLLEDVAVRARHQWKYVMADECQDTDDLQFRLLQLITEKHGNVLCVGDPGQSIYMFRGANPENLTEFTKWFPKGRYLYLGKNYRSTHTITQFVRENYPIQTPLQDRLLPARGSIGEPVEFRAFNSEQDEAESAVASAQRDPLNSAILARTNRMLGPIENFCIENNIKYTLLGRSGFWKQSEITRAIEKLKPFSHLKTEAAMSIAMPGIERHYQVEDATEEDNDALENLRTLREISRKFPACQDFVRYANRASHAKRNKGITISTVHQAKGTEYTNVFLIGCRDGMIPHSKGEGGEEKRIFFVAISRASDRLRISFVGTPSPFVRRYLTPEILASLQENVGKVERLQKQFNLLEQKDLNT